MYLQQVHEVINNTSINFTALQRLKQQWLIISIKLRFILRDIYISRIIANFQIRRQIHQVRSRVSMIKCRAFYGTLPPAISMRKNSRRGSNNKRAKSLKAGVGGAWYFHAWIIGISCSMRRTRIFIALFPILLTASTSRGR